MKKISGAIVFNSLMVFLLFVQAIANGQDSTTSSHTETVTKTTTTTNWYAQPWVWVVGGAVFIIILVALFRGNSSKNTEVTRSSTTVIKDDRSI